MARVIKFRVWDKSMARMHVCGDNSHDSMTFDMDGNAEYYNLQNGEGSGPGSCYELMQWTGLKDKNGWEIYEGDIYRSADGKDTGVIEYRGAGFYVEWKPPVTYGLRGFLYHVDDGEVIGNIHANPELLNA